MHVLVAPTMYRAVKGYNVEEYLQYVEHVSRGDFSPVIFVGLNLENRCKA